MRVNNIPNIQQNLPIFVTAHNIYLPQVVSLLSIMLHIGLDIAAASHCCTNHRTQATLAMALATDTTSTWD